MSFYKSGFRRIVNANRANLGRAKNLSTNEKADDLSRTNMQTAINLNSSKTGITSTQANAIVANTAKVSQGLATPGYSLTFGVNVERDGTTKLVIYVLEDGARTPKTVEITLT